MGSCFKVLFYLKKGKREVGKKLPVYVRVTINGKRAEWSLNRQWESGLKWNKLTGRATGSMETARKLNEYLDAVQGNIFDIERESVLRKEFISAEDVRSRMLYKSADKQYTLIQVYEHHNRQFKALVGIEYSNGTYKKFKSARKSVENFISWKFDKKDVHLHQIDHKFITDYEFYLKSVQKLQHNSAMGNIKKLKKIVRQCIANDWMVKDPFKSFKISMRDTNRNFLLKQELQLLQDKKISIPRLDQVRDIFLFSCYTGLSYSDVTKLTIHDIAIGIDGEQWIFTTRSKTDTPSRIPLLPIVKDIVEKYKNHPDILNKGTVLPKLSNQKLNSYLKELCDICGIQKALTFHCARHTFATTVTLTNGVPIETVGKMLGHKNLRTTQQYAKILDNKVSKDMNELKRKLMA